MTETTPRRRRSWLGALFDIRNVIGSLIGLYGLGLLVAGLFPGFARAGSAEATDPHDVTDMAAGSSANLWVGAALVLLAVVFLGWAALRPARRPG